MNSLFNPSTLSQLDLARFQRYRESLDFYRGEQWSSSGGQSRRERRLTFNYARVMVDKITSYLMSSLNFAFEAAGNNKSQALEAEKAIYEVYHQNSLSSLDFDTEVDCAVLGDACYKVTWDETEKRVRVTAPDPQGLYAWWLGDDVSRIWRVASRYSLSPEELGLLYPDSRQQTTPMYRDGPQSTGKSHLITEVWTAQEFTLYIDNAVHRQGANPYGFIPFVIFPNLREPKQFWGISDIPALTEPQRELNRALSQLSRILELSGNPIAVLENVEGSEDIAVHPGAVWNIPEDAKAYLLDLLQGGGMRLHIDYMDLIYRAMHDISESPRAAFGGTERDLSGVALEIELHPLLQKVKRKRTIRNPVYLRRNEMILALLKQFRGLDFGPVSQRIIWGPVLPQDTGRTVQNEQILVQSGIHSRRRAMDELGLRDPESEFARWMEERKFILEQNGEAGKRSVIRSAGNDKQSTIREPKV